MELKFATGYDSDRFFLQLRNSVWTKSQQ